MTKYLLIYLLEDKRKYEKKLINYIDMHVVLETDFLKNDNKYKYIVNAEKKANNIEEATNYFKDLYKYTEEVRII